VRFKVGPYKKTVFEDEDILFLQTHWHLYTNPELAKHLGCTLTILRNKLHAMGLKRMEMEYWTEEQIRFLKDNYSEIGDKEMAKIFESKWQKKKRWTEKHIRKKRCYLNLHRTEHQILGVKLRNVINGSWSINHWRRWYGRSNPEGTVVYWQETSGKFRAFIKVDNKYVLHTRFLWEKNYGPIPKGKVIRLKKENQFNLTIEDLELVTYTENAQKNLIKLRENRDALTDAYVAARIAKGDFELAAEVLKYPSLIELKRQQLILTKKLKEHELNTTT
jgi:hypothetical protein